MAITRNYTSDEIENEFWFDFDEAYFKIEANELRTDFNKDVIKVPVRGYASKAARENKANGIFKRVFNIEFPKVEDKINLYDRDSLIAYCYGEISKLPFFTNGSKL